MDALRSTPSCPLNERCVSSSLENSGESTNEFSFQPGRAGDHLDASGFQPVDDTMGRSLRLMRLGIGCTSWFQSLPLTNPSLL